MNNKDYAPLPTFDQEDAARNVQEGPEQIQEKKNTVLAAVRDFLEALSGDKRDSDEAHQLLKLVENLSEVPKQETPAVDNTEKQKPAYFSPFLDKLSKLPEDGAMLTRKGERFPYSRIKEKLTTLITMAQNADIQGIEAMFGIGVQEGPQFSSGLLHSGETVGVRAQAASEAISAFATEHNHTYGELRHFLENMAVKGAITARSQSGEKKVLDVLDRAQTVINECQGKDRDALLLHLHVNLPTVSALAGLRGAVKRHLFDVYNVSDEDVEDFKKSPFVQRS